jgi:hypothetical protein
MEIVSESGEPPQRIRGLELPAALASLLASGRWQHPGDDVLRRAVPWFESPLHFLHSVTAVASQSDVLDTYADDDWSSRYFHITRHTRERGHYLGLPWLDAGLALMIAVNQDPGDDLAIALDYRSQDGSPIVVGSDAWTYPRGYLWRPVAPSFDAFASMLGIES